VTFYFNSSTWLDNVKTLDDSLFAGAYSLQPAAWPAGLLQCKLSNSEGAG